MSMIQQIRERIGGNREQADLVQENPTQTEAVQRENGPEPSSSPFQEQESMDTDVHQQWYEQDPDRWHLECQAMEQIGFSSGILPDGRACFIGNLQSEESIEVVVMCDWLYPLRPPQIFAEGQEDVDVPLPKGDDNSISVLSRIRSWKPDYSASTMVEYLEDVVELALNMKISGTETKNDHKDHDEDIEGTEEDYTLEQ